MIIGIGHDVIDVQRIARMLDGRHGEKFLMRVMTEGERRMAEQCRGSRLHQFTAGRFALKEAVSKALGCGIGEIVGFSDIDISRDEYGKPICALAEEVWLRLGLNAEFIRIHVTITHERNLASAIAIVERIK